MKRYRGVWFKGNIGFCCLLSVLLLNTCSGIRELAESVGVKHPTVQFAGAKITGLSFQDADFMFDIRIQNPNPVGIQLTGFDYDVLINGKSFVRGDQDEGLEIKAQGGHIVHIPVSLGFSNIYETFTDLKKEDSSTYEMNCGFSFNLPVLGPVRVPVGTKGDLPLIKLPSIDLEALKLNRLDLSGADLQLDIRINNPNSFSLLLEGLKYQLLIGGQPWASSEAEHHMGVTGKGEGILTLPISLNFAQIGQSVYRLLTGDQSLEYELKGDLDLTTSLPLLEQANLPFDLTGVTELMR